MSARQLPPGLRRQLEALLLQLERDPAARVPECDLITRILRANAIDDDQIRRLRQMLNDLRMEQPPEKTERTDAREDGWEDVFPPRAPDQGGLQRELLEQHLFRQSAIYDKGIRERCMRQLDCLLKERQPGLSHGRGSL